MSKAAFENMRSGLKGLRENHRVYRAQAREMVTNLKSVIATLIALYEGDDSILGYPRTQIEALERELNQWCHDEERAVYLVQEIDWRLVDLEALVAYIDAKQKEEFADAMQRFADEIVRAASRVRVQERMPPQ